MKRTMSFMVVSLLLGLVCCGPKPRPYVPGPVGGGVVKPCLDSPLLARAEEYALSDPQRNYLSLVEIGHDALLARLHLIRSARTSIEVQTMIWANDETGRLIMYELIEAARRGVEVRLLIDHFASEQHIEVATFLGYLNPNLKIRLFNPITGLFGKLKAEPNFFDKLNAAILKFDRTNRRMHNKIFIVDGLVGITGGRNYQNAYYDQATGMNYKDRDILAIGPVVSAMQESFDNYWGSKRAIDLTRLVDVKKFRRRGEYPAWQGREAFALGDRFGAMEREAGDAGLIAERFVVPLQPVDKAQFIADDPRQSTWALFRSNGHSAVTEELARLVRRARESLYIQTPYLVLSSPATRLFKKLRKKRPGLDIRISTNSLAATDSWYVYAISYKQKKVYLDDLKFRIYEFKPLPGDRHQFMPGFELMRQRADREWTERVEARQAEAAVGDGGQPVLIGRDEPFLCMHAKSLVIDDAVAFVGSYNLDPRSENINTEAGLVIHDPVLARQLKERIVADMQPHNAWVIAKKNRPQAINEANEVLLELSSLIPIVDPWPIRNSASFELRGGREPVEVGHPDFYRNYRDVGSFPGVGIGSFGKELGVHGTKMFLGFVKPLL